MRFPGPNKRNKKPLHCVGVFFCNNNEMKGTKLQINTRTKIKIGKSSIFWHNTKTEGTTSQEKSVCVFYVETETEREIKPKQSDKHKITSDAPFICYIISYFVCFLYIFIYMYMIFCIHAPIFLSNQHFYLFLLLSFFFVVFYFILLHSLFIYVYRILCLC